MLLRATLLLSFLTLGCVHSRAELPRIEADILADVLSYWRRRTIDSTPVALHPGARSEPLPSVSFNQPPASAPFSDRRPARVWERLQDASPLYRAEPDLQPLLNRYHQVNQRPTFLRHAPLVPGLETVLLTAPPDLGAPAIYLSRPVLTPTADTALVRINEVCGGTCGDGAFLLLLKVGRRWQVIRVLEVEFS